jgi:hypothetical protein
MMRPGAEVCVFCGRAIAPDEPSVGRGESAAHVSCADAALGDEERWERIAAAVGEPGAATGAGPPGLPGDGEEPGDERARAGTGAGTARAGCATLAIFVLVGVLAAASGMFAVVRRSA